MRLNISRLAPLAVAGCALLAPASATATSTGKQIKSSIAADVGFLESQQQPDGSFATDWALDSLAAAKVAAADLKPSGGATDARSWYRALVGDPATWPGGANPPVAEFERAALVSYAAGIDPARVSAEQNLIAQIVARYQTANPGYYGPPSDFGGTLFGLLALAGAKTTGGKQRVPQALLEQTVAVLRANQHDDGGWAFERAEGNPTALAEPSEPDETGAAIAALCSAGVANTNATITRAVSFLEADLAEGGGFNDIFGINTDSNAWAVQGLDACGISSQGAGFTSPAGRTPIDFLISEQLPDGGLEYEPGEGEPNEYSSQDGLRSLAGAGFTAAPPKPHGGAPKWVAEGSFHAGVHSLLTLVIDNPAAPLQACSVTITGSAATSTLGVVLRAAETSSTPAGCVSSFEPAGGPGPLTELNGSPSPPEARWQISIDGAGEKPAKLSSKIEEGDTISLELH